jgi:UDP-N-acetylmuramate dehydrogenase
MEYLKDFNLAEYTSWRVGGSADHAVFPETVEDLQEACRWAQARQMPLTILSGGTNVLVSDRGIEGLTIVLKKFSKIDDVEYKNGRLTLTCYSGTPKADVLKVFVKHRLSPAIFLAGLPGDMGGGVVMNAGVGHDVAPKEFCEIVEWIEYIDLNDAAFAVKRKSAKEINWVYRKSEGWKPGIITRIGIAWTEQPDDTVLKRLQEGNKRRMGTQPLQYPSCGSVFKNPTGDKSGRLIESCGLKGYTIGGAQVSEKHANFIINVGGATAGDILAVKNHVQKTVQDQTGFELETEFVFLGRP